MNYIVICVTTKLLKINSSIRKKICAAIVGSIAIIICILKGMYIFNSIISSFIMVGIVEEKNNKRLFVMHVLVMWLVAFAIGGGLNVVINMNNFSLKNSLLEIVILSAVIAVFVKIGIWFLYENNNINKNICDVKLKYNGDIINIKGIVDTGNLLYEPITHKPVSIVEEEFIKGSVEINYIIPYKSIGNENGTLYGVKAEKMIVCDNGIEHVNNNVIIAIYDGKLSSNGSYRMIIHSDMLYNNTKGAI